MSVYLPSKQASCTGSPNFDGHFWEAVKGSWRWSSSQLGLVVSHSPRKSLSLTIPNFCQVNCALTQECRACQDMDLHSQASPQKHVGSGGVSSLESMESGLSQDNLKIERNAPAISQNVTLPLESTLMWPKVTYKAKIKLQNYQQ